MIQLNISNNQQEDVNLSADASNKKTLPVVQHGLLQETLLSLALRGRHKLMRHFPTCACVYVCVFACVTYQHEVDVEIKDLVAHVDAEVVAEMVPQVGESPRRALEVCARHLHPLDAEPRVSGIVCAHMFTIVLCVCVTVSYLLGHPVIHGPQHRVQGPYGETKTSSVR